MQPRSLTSPATIRLIIWIAIASLIAVFVLGSTRGIVLAATSLHQATPISWDDPAFQGTEDECDDVALDAGEVLWHFVLVQTTAGTSSTVSAVFANAGPVSIPAWKKTGTTLHFFTITGQDTLLSAMTSANGRQLNLSHICSGPPETTTTTTTTITTTATTTTP